MDNSNTTENDEQGSALEASGIMSNTDGMQSIEELKVRCWKLFGSDSVPVYFKRRISTIVGPIGSGKSSILEAIFTVIASFEKKGWTDVLCSLPRTRDIVSFTISGQSSDKEKWTRSLKQAGKMDADLELTIPDGPMPSVCYVPQDHGLKIPERYAEFEWCFTFGKLRAGKYHTLVLGSSQLHKKIEKFCGVEFKEKGSFQLSRSEQKAFGAENLSGGQVDAILCLLALFHAKSKSECVVLLDEPGQNLGAHERELLRHEIYKCPRQVILVTHHVEMLDRKHLPDGLIRFMVPGAREWRKKGALVASYINGEDLMKELASGNDESAKNRKNLFQAFVRSPENLRIFFADSVALVEGVTDVRTLKAVDEVWASQVAAKWDGLECLVLSTDGHNCRPLWKIFHSLKHILKMRVFCLLDLDVLWKSSIQEKTPSDVNMSDVKGKLVRGGAVYYCVQSQKNSEVWNDLLEVVMAEHEIVVERIAMKWVKALKKLQEKKPELSFAASFLGDVYQTRSVPEISPPEYLSSVVKALNFLLLSNPSFPAFVWPPRVADIEGVLFDKTWVTASLSASEFSQPSPLSELQKMDNALALGHGQIQLACDVPIFVQSSLLYTSKSERQVFLQKAYRVQPSDESKISFTKRYKSLKDWFSWLSATDYNGLVDLLTASKHPLHVKFCTGWEQFGDAEMRRKQQIEEAREEVRQKRSLKKNKSGKAQNPGAKEESQRLRDEDLVGQLEKHLADSNFQGILKLLREEKFVTALGHAAGDPLQELAACMKESNYRGILALLSQDEFHSSLLRAANSQLGKVGTDFDETCREVQETFLLAKEEQWKKCLIRDQEIHPVCAIMWRLKTL